MDIGKSITFVFEDKRWIEKLLIGGLIVLGTVVLSWTIIFAILGAALLYGYMVEIIRNVRRGDSEPLPEWNEWGQKIVLGIKLMVAYFIWALPLLIVWVPLILFGILAGVSESDAITGFFAVVLLCFACLSAIYAILFIVLMPSITIQLAERGEISDTLKFGEVFNFTKVNLGNIIIVVLVLVVVQFVANFIGILLCGIGLLFTSVYAYMVQGHLYGQIGLEKEKAQQREAAQEALPAPTPEEAGSSEEEAPAEETPDSQ